MPDIFYISRYKFKYKVPANKGYMEKTEEEKGDNPLGIKMFAGSAYYVFTYEAVDFIVNGLFFKSSLTNRVLVLFKL